MVFENVVVGSPIVDLCELFDDDLSWVSKTYFTHERYLPRILKNIGLVPSTSWVKKNRPDLDRELNELDCFEVRIGKMKPPVYFVVGK